ncbi:DUF948 domain-containing protein [Inediibacterium massiliense]|uniref:DUF948 domain-containing protein n=1 Tax=Inediibacterium massiliense TaxID=1658111 RepID=UPI0006B49CD7|nr:DUF948 domain-containing protein [Inediibacterium massiliense]
MEVRISLGDLGIFFLGGAFFILLIYGIILLKNLNDTLNMVKKVIGNNEQNIDQVLEEAPSIAKNIESLSHDLSHNVKAAQSTFDQILGTTEIAASKVSDHTDLLSSLMGIVQAIYTIKEFFESKKRGL